MDHDGTKWVQVFLYDIYPCDVAAWPVCSMHPSLCILCCIVCIFCCTKTSINTLLHSADAYQSARALETALSQGLRKRKHKIWRAGFAHRNIGCDTLELFSYSALLCLITDNKLCPLTVNLDLKSSLRSSPNNWLQPNNSNQLTQYGAKNPPTLPAISK